MGNSNISVHAQHEPNRTDRMLILPTGSTLGALKVEVLETFNDLIPDGSCTNLRIEWFDGKNYVEMTESQVLKDKDKIRWTCLSQSAGPVIPHPIEDNASYYIWSLKKSGLLKRSANNEAQCNGNKMDPSNRVLFKAHDVSSAGKLRYAFKLPGSTDKKVYAIKGQAVNKPVVFQELDESIDTSIPDEYKFECLQYFGFTQFRCENVGGRDDLFLNASPDGSVKLTMAGTKYPDPNTLFITQTEM